jgi:hypothetical protein
MTKATSASVSVERIDDGLSLVPYKWLRAPALRLGKE